MPKLFFDSRTPGIDVRGLWNTDDTADVGSTKNYDEEIAFVHKSCVVSSVRERSEHSGRSEYLLRRLKRYQRRALPALG